MTGENLQHISDLTYSHRHTNREGANLGIKSKGIVSADRNSGHLFQKQISWKILDILIGLIMWGIAVNLLWPLLK